MEIPAGAVGAPVALPSQNTKVSDERKVEKDSELERSEAERSASSDRDRQVDQEKDDKTRDSDLQNGIGGHVNVEV
jgi:hypothetical protein